MLSIQKQNKHYNTKKYKTPFLVLDERIIEKKYKAIKNSIKGIEIFYAVKANSDIKILKTLKKLGSGFEIASKKELDDLLKIKVGRNRIISSNPNKLPNFIKAANRAKIKYHVFDSKMEIDKLSKWAPGSKVYLRIAVSNVGSEWPLSKKFGADPKHAIDLLKYAQNTNVNPCGISFHVGSQCMNIKNWSKALAVTAKIFKEAKKSNINLEIINIGGGIPIQYLKNTPEVKKVGKEISSSIKKYFGKNKIRLMIEPGRSVVGDAGNITTKVILRARRGSENWLYLDIGIFHGLMEALEGIKYKIISDKHIDGGLKNKDLIPYTIAGPTCDSVDTIYKNYLLPKDLKLGDKLYILNTGAYTTSYSSNFNGIKPLKTFYIKK